MSLAKPRYLAARGKRVLMALLVSWAIPAAVGAQRGQAPRVEASVGFGTGSDRVVGISALGVVAVNVTSTGAIDWRVVGALHQRLSFLERSRVNTFVPDQDTSEVRTLLRTGVEMRINAFEGRLAPTIGLGQSYGRWHDLPLRDADRGSLRGAYLSAGCMLRPTSRVTVDLLAISWRRVVHGGNETMGALTVRLPYP